MFRDPAIEVALPELTFAFRAECGSKAPGCGVPAKGNSVAAIEDRPGGSTQKCEKSAN